MIEEFIEITNKATSKEEVYQLFLKALKNFGYDRTIYTYNNDKTGIKRKTEHGSSHSNPDDHMDRYFSSGKIKNDPTFKRALVFNGPFYWDNLSKVQEFSKIKKQIMNESNDRQLYGCVGVSILRHFGNLSAIGIASSHKKSEPDLDDLRKLNALSRQFYLAYSDHNHEHSAEKKITLSPRESEILLWAAEGKSDPVIAELLEIKHSTVRFHIQNIFKKLGVNERTMAVVKAIKMRLISPSYIGFPYKG